MVLFCAEFMTDLFDPSQHPGDRRYADSRKDRPPPPPWRKVRAKLRYRWAVPFVYSDWLAGWAAYALGRLSFIELLEIFGSCSVLIAVIFYFAESGQRTQARHYQAWQVINTAQGKGGNGGRIDALAQLNDDHIPLVGVDVSDAYLEGVRLENADLRRSRLSGADLKDSDLARADMEEATLRFANLRDSNLTGCMFLDANLTDADLTGADLSGADLQGAVLDRADLTNADLAGVLHWQSIAGIAGATLQNVRNPPDGFLAWAKAHSAGN
jgi:hypothetical protein